MPRDLRDFFTRKPGSGKPPPALTPPPAASAARKRNAKIIIVSDDDDEDYDDNKEKKGAVASAAVESSAPMAPPAKRSRAAAPAAAAPPPKPPVVEISPSDYFATKVPTRRSGPASATVPTPVTAALSSPFDSSSSDRGSTAAEVAGPTSAPAPAAVAKAVDPTPAPPVPQSAVAPAAPPRTRALPTAAAAAAPIAPPAVKATPTAVTPTATVAKPAASSSSRPSRSAAKRRRRTIDEDDEEDDDDDYKQRGNHDDDDGDDDMEVVVTTKRPATTNTMKPMPIRPVVAPVPIPAAVGNPYSAGSPLSVSQPPSSSPAVPTPIIDTSNMDPEEARKANYRAFLERKAAGPAGPSNPGSKVIPVGQPNCLHGLTFVLSGDFESLARNEMEDLIKRYNGRVTGSVSGKTSYLVRGDNAGMSKTKKAEQLGTKVITEDDVLDLIGKSAGKSDAQVDATKSAAVTKRDAALAKIDERVAAAHPAALWTDKYRPTKCSEIIGNKANVDRLLQWLRGFAKARTTKFRFEGEKSLAHYRAALLSGPPGVGKTTSAHVAAREAGLNVIEFNASDMRSKKSLDEIAAHLLHNQTLFGGKSGDDHVVIMDEVDGMSTSDRGGLAELTKLIAKSRVPVICICNDRSNPKLKTLAAKCLDLPYRRPEAQMVRSRLMTICHREGLKVPPTAIDALHASTRADIRQMITLLSSYRLSHTAMDYDDAKRHGADQEKDMSVGMFEATRVLLSPADVRRSSLNQLMEQYFVDFDMVPLMVQENYVKVRAAHDPIEALARLSAAADAIAVSDHVSAMIRGQQQWGLLPTHAVFSAAVPAHAMCSGATCSGSSGMYVFTSALGNMSRTAKFGRILAGVDQRIGRLSHGAGAGRAGARLDYIPAMSEILHSRWKQGGTGTAQLIETMDAYYLGREDLDDVLALRVGRRSGDVLLKEIPGTAKAAFTREYNKTSHPAFEVGVPASKRAAAMGLGSGGGGPDYDDGGEPDVDGYEAPAGTGDDQDNAEEEKDDENEEALRAALAKQAKAGSGAKSRGKGKGPASATTTAAHKSRSK